MLLEITDTDRAFYEQHLTGFLPPRMIDTHTHVWLDAFRKATDTAPRGPTWPNRVASQQTVEDLAATYRAMFPASSVTSLLLGMPTRDIDLELTNAYVAECAARSGYPALLVSTPEWPAEELERRAQAGGFRGLKPYLELAPAHIASADVEIFDFLPRQHLEVANHHGWLVVLHIPRPRRLKDPVNLAQMLEIERNYPRVRLIIAHIGRAYCPEDVGDAFAVVGETRRMCFDICANTNPWVMEQLLRAVGPQRVLFGSDLPIVRMRMRRICENGSYVNLVPPGLYGDVSNDSHMREVSQAEGERLTFFLYEELLAFRQAAEAVGLSAEDVADVLYGNAARMLGITHSQQPL